MASKKKTKKPVERNPVVEIARARTSAGPMKSKSTKRKRGRKAWRKDLDKLISGE
jgi:hypothetical protein